MKTKKSVFFARLKKWAACLWLPSLPCVALQAKRGGRRQILRLSLLKKQGLSSTPSRAKTVLIRVKNKFCEICEICGWEYFNQKYLPCEAHRAKKGQIMRNEPNFSKSQMFITLIKTTNYNKKWTMDTWSKRTQTNPIFGTTNPLCYNPPHAIRYTHDYIRITSPPLSSTSPPDTPSKRRCKPHASHRLLPYISIPYILMSHSPHISALS